MGCCTNRLEIPKWSNLCTGLEAYHDGTVSSAERENTTGREKSQYKIVMYTPGLKADQNCTSGNYSGTPTQTLENYGQVFTVHRRVSAYRPSRLGLAWHAVLIDAPSVASAYICIPTRVSAAQCSQRNV